MPYSWFIPRALRGQNSSPSFVTHHPMKVRPKSIHHVRTVPKMRGAETRQAYSRFTGVNSREFVRKSQEFRTNFVRIPHKFHVNSRDFTQMLPVCTP